MKRKYLFFVATVFVLILMGVQNGHCTLVFDYTQTFSNAVLPDQNGTDPYLKATFADQADGSVKLTLENLTNNNFVTEWDFNYSGFLDKLSITYFSGEVATVSKGADAFQADGDGKYDIQFMFPNGPPDSRFYGPGDKSVYILTSTQSGFRSGFFDLLSSPSGGSGPFLSAAHIQGIGSDGGLSTWVAPVPEPATMIISALTLIGAGGVVRRKFFKKV
jgi:hypothetical protein